MNSFSNLGYTVGGNISPGCGVGRFGYPANLNPSYATMPNANQNVMPNPTWAQPQPQQPQSNNATVPIASPNQGNTWNGWQYGGNAKANQQSQGSQMQSFRQENPANWRSMPGQGVPVNPQQYPTTTTGSSPFQCRESFTTSPSPNSRLPLQKPVQMQTQSPSNQVNQCLNVPYWTGDNGFSYGQGAPTKLLPADGNALQQFFQHQPQQDPGMACHVKLGSQGDQPVVYTGGLSGNAGQGDSHATAGSKSNKHSSQHNMMHPSQHNIQHPAAHAQAQSPLNYQHFPLSASPQVVKKPAPVTSLSRASSNQRQGYSPCGNCPACQFQAKDKNRRPGQPRLVRGSQGQQKKSTNPVVLPQQPAMQNSGEPTTAPGMVQLQTFG